MGDAPLFGTDGVRGRANVDLTPELAMGLARAAADGRQGTAVVGRDTRRSGQMLAAAVHAGFHAAGFDTVDVGILPVGAVSYLTASTRAAYGVMVSASHNPAEDNGIKFFGTDGAKLDEESERAIEARFRHGPPWVGAEGAEVGIQLGMPDALARYLDQLAGGARFRLGGMSVALDCAHGAACVAAPALFARLGADVVAHAAEPTGSLIARSDARWQLELFEEYRVLGLGALGVGIGGALSLDLRRSVSGAVDVTDPASPTFTAREDRDRSTRLRPLGIVSWELAPLLLSYAYQLDVLRPELSSHRVTVGLRMESVLAYE